MNIKLDRVNFVDNNNLILKDIILELKNGITGIFGKCGSGKTTLINIIMGVIPIKKGSCYFENRVVNKKNKGIIFKKSGILYQNPKLQIFKETLEEDYIYYLKQRGILDKNNYREKLFYYLDYFNIDRELIKKYYYNLKTSDVKLIIISMLMSVEPDIIVLDEPLVSLGYDSIKRLLKLLYNKTKENSIIPVILSNNMEQIFDYCDKIVYIEKGSIIFNGDKKSFGENFNIISSDVKIPQNIYLMRELVKSELINYAGDYSSWSIEKAIIDYLKYKE